MPRILPKNMPPSLDLPHVGADALLAGAARAYPDRLALVDGKDTLTYAQLHDAALRVAGGLRARGLRPGDVAALHLPNTLWYLVAYYGALCAGVAVAPVNPAQPAAALRTQLTDCGAQAVFTHPSNAAVLNEALGAEKVLAIHVPGSAAAPAPEAAVLPRGAAALTDLLDGEPLHGYAVDPELVAHLQLTGGTTGRSKAVRVLHRNLVANVLQAACWRSSSLPLRDDHGGVTVRRIADPAPRTVVPGACVSLAISPLFHGLGLVGQNQNVVLGSTVVLSGGRFDPQRFLAAVTHHGVTHLAGSPAMYYAILGSPELHDHDLSSVVMLNSGAAPIDTTALAALAEAFPNAAVGEGYGLSEATMGLTAPPPGATVPTPTGSVGVPLFDTELEIRAEDGSTVLPQGEVGEVWARGPQITDGYQGAPELTAAQFADGWLRTGDMGRVDENGFLFLVGRAKDMLIYKGYNVYPQPLEELLCGHPAVAQAAVVGREDAGAGEIPVGFVVLHERRGGAEAGLTEEILAHVAARVAPYQRVRELHVVDALPFSPTGKVLKTELRELLRARL